MSKVSRTYALKCSRAKGYGMMVMVEVKGQLFNLNQLTKAFSSFLFFFCFSPFAFFTVAHFLPELKQKPDQQIPIDLLC